MIAQNTAATEMTTLKMDFATMFANSDKDNCPITCSLKVNVCKDAYTGENIKLVKGDTGYTV